MFTAKQVLTDELNETEKKRLNRAYAFIYKYATPQQGVDKEKVAAVLGLKGERTGRDYVSALKKRCPVISHNAFKGFRIAKTAEDVPDNERTIFEVLSRCEEMLYGIIPNFEFERKQKIEYSDLELAVHKFLGALEQPKIAQMIMSANNKFTDM